MAVMSNDDWAAYREGAAQQTQNMNSATNVLDPSKLTGDAMQNRALLYGASGDASSANGTAKTIADAFVEFFGKQPSQADYSAWLRQAASGVDNDGLRKMIEAASKDPRNAGIINTAGLSGGAATATATANPLNFAGGLMGGYGNGFMGG